MRPLKMSGLNPLSETSWTILCVENDTIGLATTEDNLTFDTVVEIKLSKENICKLRDYLTEYLEDSANRYYLIYEDGKYLNIDSDGYIGFGEKESKYKNTFTDREIDDYYLSNWITSGKVKKILVENTNNKTE